MAFNIDIEVGVSPQDRRNYRLYCATLTKHWYVDRAPEDVKAFADQMRDDKSDKRPMSKTQLPSKPPIGDPRKVEVYLSRLGCNPAILKYEPFQTLLDADDDIRSGLEYVADKPFGNPIKSGAFKVHSRFVKTAPPTRWFELTLDKKTSNLLMYENADDRSAPMAMLKLDASTRVVKRKGKQNEILFKRGQRQWVIECASATFSEWSVALHKCMKKVLSQDGDTNVHQNDGSLTDVPVGMQILGDLPRLWKALERKLICRTAAKNFVMCQDVILLVTGINVATYTLLAVITSLGAARATVVSLSEKNIRPEVLQHVKLQGVTMYENQGFSALAEAIADCPDRPIICVDATGKLAMFVRVARGYLESKERSFYESDEVGGWQVVDGLDDFARLPAVDDERKSHGGDEAFDEVTTTQTERDRLSDLSESLDNIKLIDIEKLRGIEVFDGNDDWSASAGSVKKTEGIIGSVLDYVEKEMERLARKDKRLLLCSNEEGSLRSSSVSSVKTVNSAGSGLSSESSSFSSSVSVASKRAFSELSGRSSENENPSKRVTMG